MPIPKLRALKADASSQEWNEQAGFFNRSNAAEE